MRGTATIASNGAVQFVKVLSMGQKLDLAQLARITDVPFSFCGVINFNTRAEFDDFLKMQLVNGDAKQQEIKFKVIKVVPGVRYLAGGARKRTKFPGGVQAGADSRG